MARVSSHRRGRRRIAPCLLALCTILALAACADEHTPVEPTARSASSLESIASLKGDRVVSVDVTPSPVSIAVGDTTTLSATPRDAKGNPLTNRPVTWTISDTTIARVSSGGVVTARATGTATISATSDARTGTAALTVTAPKAPPGTCSVVTGWNARPLTPMARPSYLQPVLEPDFGTTIVRVTGDPGTPIANVGGTWGTLSGHGYAKDPVWNADQSLILLKVVEGLGAWLFLDGSTYEPVFKRGNVPGADDRWHPTLPDVMAFVDFDGSVGFWNVRTQSVTRKFTPPAGAYSGASMGRGEGNVSYDGRWVAVQAKRNSDGRQVAYAVDIEAGTKGPDVDLAAFGVSNADWVSISAGGGYLVTHGVIDGVGQRVRAWTRTGTATAYWPTHPMGHFDLGIDPAGREVAFGGDAGTINPTQYVALDLASGAVRPLSGGTTWDWHASTRNVRRPGWGVGVTNDRTAFALSGEIYAIRLDGSQTVERYGRHRTNNSDYDAAPFASPSPDGKRIMFRSNWGASSGRPVGAYVIDTRPICP